MVKIWTEWSWNVKILSWHSPVKTEENHEKFQPEQPVTQIRFKLHTSQI
jgi:hypothetical protein